MRTLRDNIKDKLDSLINHQQRSEEIITELAEIYQLEHPEIVEQLKVIFNYIEQLIATMESFRSTY